MPSALPALAGSLTDDRAAQLLQLEELGRERDDMAVQVKTAAERTTEKHTEYDNLRRKRDDAQQAVIDARENMAGEWRKLQRDEGWVAELADYRLAEVVSSLLRASLEEYRPLVASILQEGRQAGQQLDKAHSTWLQQLGGQQKQLAELERDYQRLQAATDRLPSRTRRRQAARDLLTQHGLTAYPFYALLDFKPGVAAEQSGAVEQLLEDAGLLDALVVTEGDSRRAGVLLAEANLSDTFLSHAGQRVANGAPTLADWLIFDPTSLTNEQAEWEQIVTELLYAPLLKAGNEASLLDWEHGRLAGQVGPTAALGYIGLANRQRLRQSELAELQKRLESAQEELAGLQEQISRNRDERGALQQQQIQLEGLERAETVANAELEKERAESESGRAERKLQEAQTLERELRQGLNALVARLLQQTAELGITSNNTRQIRSLYEATVSLKHQVALLQQRLGSTLERWQEFGAAQSQVETQRQALQIASDLQAQSQAQVTRTQAELAELENLNASADLEQMVERVAYLRQRNKALPPLLQEAAVVRGRTEERLQNLANMLEEARQNLEAARQKRMAAQGAFSMKLLFYPASVLLDAQALDRQGDSFKAANLLLRGPEGDTLPSEDELETDYNRVAGQLLSEFNKQRAFLAEYGPDLDEESRIVFVAEDQIEPPALLNLLAHQIDVQKTLLDKEERGLFEDFLLREMAEAIRLHIGEAEQWVADINKVLYNLPMVGERYSLEWKALEATEIAEGYGSHIARHHRLLSKPIQELSQEENQLILDALRREIDGLRLRQKDEPGLNFMDALVQIFDYREWFRFGIFITPQGGSRIRLTDRNAGTRSGAEQLFALYVPLFAALAALYGNRAGAGSPRLLALDEAFDKSSLGNTQKIMQFLVMQNFQWIMTGPQLSATGSGVPANAEYQMLHEKGTQVATAVPFYWIAGQSS